MNVVVIGSGGREHALAWRLEKSPSVNKVFVLPGNPGMEEGNIQCRQVDPFSSEIFDFLGLENIELVVVGPEAPLTSGIVEFLGPSGVPVFGPSRYPAQLEGSKAFSKECMLKWGVPTAEYKECNSAEEARRILATWQVEDKGVVLKADGLAAGKGVVVTHDRKEAEDTIFRFMEDDSYPVQAEKLVIEEFLEGRELSVFAYCDGEKAWPLGYAQDHKRLLDGDEGPNTGGMGCIRRRDWPTSTIQKDLVDLVCSPIVAGMKKEGHPYKGFLFAGLMIKNEQIKVLEYNVRFGDPETQTLLPLVEGDMGVALLEAAKGVSQSQPLSLKDRASVHVVLASGGYPGLNGPIEKGHPVTINEETRHALDSGEGNLFYAGVGRGKDGELLNNGGRVLGVTCVGDELEKTREKVYQLIKGINFNGVHYRKDIGL